MGGADLMLASGLVSALGWALVHFLWQGCLIAVGFWLVCVLSSRESAHLRYWAGVGGLCLSILALGATFAIYYEPDATFTLTAASESVNSFLVLSGSLPDMSGVLQDGIEPALPWVVLIWLAGVLWLSGCAALDWLGLRRLVRRDAVDAGEAVSRMTRGLEEKLGLRRAVRVLQSARITVPMAVGWIRPVIVIPASVMMRLPPAQLEMVLAHELGHIRRYDHLINWLQVTLETLLFYHPAIRWMSRRVREERENCCDDLVVSRCRKPATYARALTNLEMLRGPDAPTAVMAATGGNLMGRIRRIVDAELPRSSTAYAQISLMAALALIVALGAHQGLALSRALNQVASVAQVQASDIEWKTWGRSRAAWGAGLDRFVTQTRVPLARGRISDPSPFITAGLSRASALPPVQKRALAADAVPTAPEPGHVTPSSHPGPYETARLDLSPATVDKAPQRAAEPATLFVGVGLRPITLSGATVTALPGKRVPQPQHRFAARISSPVSIHPVVVEKVEPRYPWRARAYELEGSVELTFSVDGDGQPYDIDVVDSIPIGVFDRAAKKAMKQWKFKPPEGLAANLRLTQTFDFDLEDLPAERPRRRYCQATGRRTCSMAPPDAVVVYVNPPTRRSPEYQGARLD
ncbi:M56 family metallopeptidase [Elongatibacter sediminis]|uniref:Protein TonB n=1 Tax=Elongatibacter sediminis TaxID=3119006 RepID=A0AAW9RFJ6_9GAMM